MQSELKALAERVMALTGPDRETFMAAFYTCYPMPSPDCEPAWREKNPKQPLYHAWETRRIAFMKFVAAEAWLDAAMTLCGSNPSFDLAHDHAMQGGKWQCLVGDVDGWTPSGRATAATPALALTAAALLALAEQVQQ